MGHNRPSFFNSIVLMAIIQLLNGPNLNLLGQREPELYGTRTLAEIEKELIAKVSAAHHELLCFQSNAEHELIHQVQIAKAQNVSFIIINPGAFTHTSIALRDAFLASGVPFIEVHLSNIFAREAFRAHSYLSDIARGLISGLGVCGYHFALDAAIQFVEK